MPCHSNCWPSPTAQVLYLRICDFLTLSPLIAWVVQRLTIVTVNLVIVVCNWNLLYSSQVALDPECFYLICFHLISWYYLCMDNQLFLLFFFSSSYLLVNFILVWQKHDRLTKHADKKKVCSKKTIFLKTCMYTAWLKMKKK